MNDIALALCPELCALLMKHIPGGVKIAAQGEPMMYGFSQTARGRQLDIMAFGESYRVNCPFCEESRHRLWINHRYGQPHPITGRPVDNWCICFNEQCMTNPANRHTLYSRLFKLQNRNARPALVLNDAAIVTGPPAVATPPGRLERIDRFPQVANYLYGRGFGPDIWEHYGVRYCVETTNPAWTYAQNKIYVPIWFDNRYVGWQCRYPADPVPRGAPKYFTLPQMRKTQILYNFDNARGKPFVVVFEGVTHVWRFGNYGVALLGKTMSAMQRMLLQSTFSNREPIIIALDPDARLESEGILQELINGGQNPVVLLDLPPGCGDAADYDRVALWQIIYAQAAAAGVRLPYVPLQ